MPVDVPVPADGHRVEVDEVETRSVQPQVLPAEEEFVARGHVDAALDVRPEAYPYERASTRLNFLAASWDVGNDPESFNEERYQDMLVKVAEVKTLVDHEEMIAEANKHLALLEKLRATVAL